MSQQQPLDHESPPTTASNLRGAGFGCLYALISWIFVGIVAALLIPAILRGEQWNHEAIGGMASSLGLLFVSIPLGIYGFVRHRRRRTVNS